VVTAIADEPTPVTPVASQVVPPTPRVRSSATSRALAAMRPIKRPLRALATMPELLHSHGPAVRRRANTMLRACTSGPSVTMLPITIQ
jgi:hypothetical protein